MSHSVLQEGSQGILDILDRSLLRAVFQPIARFEDGAVFAYEALIRGPADSALGSADALLKSASAAGILPRLEMQCLRVVSREFARLQLPGQLFMNISAGVLLNAHASRRDWLGECMAPGLSPRRIVIELTEHERVTDHQALAAAVSDLRKLGISIALDDFGDGRSSLRMWGDLLPEYVKIDKYFVRDVDRNPSKVQVLKLLLQFTEIFSTRMIAEGIETLAELAVMRDLGAAYGQGYLLGRPASPPPLTLPDAVATELASSKIAVYPELLRLPQRHRTAAELLIPAPAVSPESSNDELAVLFRDRPDLRAVALVEAGIPVGLVNRQTFIDKYAQPYHREVYGRRPCGLFMSTSPLLIDIHTPIEALTRVLTGADQRYLADGFVVTENGAYVGLGRGEELVATVTELRIEAARHANPLTMLPGNIPITEHIARLLAAGCTFTACYFDLNHFKPFNDQYGYWRGDEMIKAAASAIGAECDPLRDFVGHVGGDDFVVLFQSEDWRERCGRVTAAFNAAARSLYNAEDAARGELLGEDRRGNATTFPLTTIAIGAVSIRAGDFRNPDDVATAAAAAKRKAKHGGSDMYVITVAELSTDGMYH